MCMFVDRCLSFRTFSFDHYVVCSSLIYGFWLPIEYLQTLLILHSNICVLFNPNILTVSFLFLCRVKLTGQQYNDTKSILLGTPGVFEAKGMSWKEKLKQWWSTILPISTKRTTTSHLKSLNKEKTTTYDFGNLGPGLWQTQTNDVIKLVNGMTTFLSWLLDSQRQYRYKLYNKINIVMAIFQQYTVYTCVLRSLLYDNIHKNG